MDHYKIVEKKNPLAVHGLFDTLETARRHLAEAIPVYVEKGYFTDKTLKPNDFEIVENQPNIKGQ